MIFGKPQVSFHLVYGESKALLNPGLLWFTHALLLLSADWCSSRSESYFSETLPLHPQSPLRLGTVQPQPTEHGVSTHGCQYSVWSGPWSDNPFIYAAMFGGIPDSNYHCWILLATEVAEIYKGMWCFICQYAVRLLLPNLIPLSS